MTDLGPSNVHRVFTALGDLMAYREVEPLWLLVCGGTALLATGLGARVTEDVDVLGQRSFDGSELSVLYPLPAKLKQCAELTGREFGLKSGWLNASASLFGNLGELPDWTWSDLETREYGERLKVSFIARSGLILLKFDAACDRDETRDLEDLFALAPNREESARALRWLEEHEKLTYVRRSKLKTLLTNLGHDDLTGEL
jgi:hypothetical protein